MKFSYVLTVVAATATLIAAPATMAAPQPIVDNSMDRLATFLNKPNPIAMTRSQQVAPVAAAADVTTAATGVSSDDMTTYIRLASQFISNGGWSKISGGLAQSGWTADDVIKAYQKTNNVMAQAGVTTQDVMRIIQSVDMTKLLKVINIMLADANAQLAPATAKPAVASQ